MSMYVILAEAVLHDCRNLSHGIQPLAAFTAPRDRLHTASWRSKAAMVTPCCRAFRSSLLSLPSQPVFTQHFGRSRQEVPNQLRSNMWPVASGHSIDGQAKGPTTLILQSVSFSHLCKPKGSKSEQKSVYHYHW